MQNEFDPYHKWLGIPAKNRSLNHYVLLNVSLDETDDEVIRSAAIRQRSHVERFLTGQHAPIAKRVIYEIDEAEITLLDPKMREQYDRQMSLSKSRRKQQKLPPRQRRGGKTVGEESGLFSEYAGVMTVLGVCFFGMAAASFYLPWSKLTKSEPEVATPAAVAPPAAPVDNGQANVAVAAPAPGPEPMADAPAVVAVPEAPLPQWKSLFDDSSLKGWTNPDGLLTVENGVVVNTGKRGVAIAPGEYSTFTAQLEFRLANKGNSGLGLLYSGDGDPAATGLEVQLLDDAGYPNLMPEQMCGSLFKLAGVTENTFRRWPEWNSLSVDVEADEIEVVLNETSVLKTSRTALQAKFPAHEGVKRPSGRLCLFPISERSEYRNFRVRETTSPK